MELRSDNHYVSQGFAEEFHAARQGDDPHAAIRTAHTLKGLAGTIGASALQQAAEKLECACRRNETDENTDSAPQQVIAELSPLIEGLDRFINAQ